MKRHAKLFQDYGSKIARRTDLSRAMGVPRLAKIGPYSDRKVDKVRSYSGSTRGIKFAVSPDGTIWTHRHLGKDRGRRRPLNGRSALLDELGFVLLATRPEGGRFEIQGRRVLTYRKGFAAVVPFAKIAKQ